MLRTGICAAILFLSCGLPSGAMLGSDEALLHAVFSDAAGPNLYQVQFPESLGSEKLEMRITSGGFDLAIDRETSATRIITWYQEIDPILIYGSSTGVITVALDGTQPAEGSFSAATGEFEVPATFILQFDDTSLRQLGFTSPFIMTATEKGIITPRGVVLMDLAGDGTFAGGGFAYTCKTSSSAAFDHAAGQAQPADVDLNGTLDINDPVSGLQYLFLGMDAACPGAIEANGDGVTDLGDAIFVLQYLFLGGRNTPVLPVECR